MENGRTLAGAQGRKEVVFVGSTASGEFGLSGVGFVCRPSHEIHQALLRSFIFLCSNSSKMCMWVSLIFADLIFASNTAKTQCTPQNLLTVEMEKLTHKSWQCRPVTTGSSDRTRKRTCTKVDARYFHEVNDEWVGDREAGSSILGTVEIRGNVNITLKVSCFSKIKLVGYHQWCVLIG